MQSAATKPFDEATEARFARYIESFADVLGHADRMTPFHAYCTGLVLPGDRKSVEPMAATVSPGSVSAARQSMSHFVAKAPWSEVAMLRGSRQYAMPLFDSEPYCFIVDDTGVPKKGKLSVGVAKQWCGVLGKEENCQVAVTLSIANERASLPIAHRLYLTEAWAEDCNRREVAGVPDDVVFETKGAIALDQIDRASKEGLRPEVVLADAGYGNSSEFREHLTARKLPYAVGIQGNTTVWLAGNEPPPVPTEYSGMGRPRTRIGRNQDYKPVSVKSLAFSLPAEAYRDITWREGTKGSMSGRYAILRVRPARGVDTRSTLRDLEWLLVEWPRGEKEPVHYHLSTLSDDATPEQLVGAVRKRWRIERDYQELKDELGLDHYEGRSWRGFHHHAALCIATYAFLMVERVCSPLSTSSGRPHITVPERPADFRPRGAPGAARTAQPTLVSNDEATPRSGAGTATRPLPLLSPSTRKGSGPR